MTNLKHSQSFQALVILSFLIIPVSCDIFEGPCSDEDLGQLYLMTSLNDISPYTENMLIYFKDSLGNEQTFEFINQNVGHGTDQHSSTNVPCPSDANKRKEYKAKTEEYYFSIIQPETVTPRINFGFNLSVRLMYLNGLMVCDMFEFHNAYPTINTIGYSSDYPTYDGMTLITHPRDCSEEFLSQYPQPTSEVTLLDKNFNDVYSSLNSNIYYNYEFGIIGFKDDAGDLWVFDRIEENK